MKLAEGMQAVVIGLGTAGLSTVRFLLDRGLRVRVSEQREQAAIESTSLDMLAQAGVALETGGHTEGFLDRADLVVPGPGVPLDLPVLAAARSRGIPVAGELALAAERFPVPVLAVTGSNGKTTVTSLLGALLAAGGRRPFVGGNIGTPLLDFFLCPGEYGAAVLELSSFQLDLAGGFRPEIGLLLNITPDHLDRHGSMAAYTRAKQTLFAWQRSGDIAVLGSDDPVVTGTPLNPGVMAVRFGRDQDCQARIVGDKVLIRTEVKGRVIEAEIDLAPTRLHSPVNRQNAAAAILAAIHAGCELSAITTALAAYQPPPHRMAEVAVIDGVRYINDSKATNIGALAAALDGCEDPVVLIAGGRDKNSDFTLLREIVGARVKRLILIGEAAPLIRRALEGAVVCEDADSMARAVSRARAAATAGDLVLLAPGCASFDMFSGYAERGRVFAEAVRAMAGLTAEEEVK